MHNRPLLTLVSIAALAAAGCSQQGAAGNGAAAAAAGPAPSSAFAFASDPCQVVMTATRAVLQHDHATQMTLPPMASETTLRQAQSVQVGGKTYIQVDNAWTLSRMTVADELQSVNDAAKTAQTTCKASGADVIAGQPVSIYDAHVVNEGSTSDNRLWIAVASGLPLKIETHLDTGGVSTQLIRYDNVTAPANVQASPG